MKHDATPRFRVEDVAFHVHPTRTRFPFRYGIASMTEVPHLFLRVQVWVGGRSQVGVASEGLPPKWFTKDPSTTFEQDLPAMYEVIGHAARLSLDAGGTDLGFFAWWQELERRQRAWGEKRGHPGLLLGLGTSLVERAVLDALCRGLGMPFHVLVLEGHLGLDLAHIHPELAGSTPRDWLPAAPLEQVPLRHTVGLADPLSPGDVPDADRVDDGLPQDLESSVRTYGLRAFKIKLCGDPGRDRSRLRTVQAILERSIPDHAPCVVTMDGNEGFPDFAAFRAFWEPLALDPALRWLMQRVVLVEQPVHRSQALADVVAGHLAGWPDRPPLIIDESDGALGDVARALALGYAGASHKSCKGVVKGIANACLLHRRRREGLAGLLTGEDLCTLGPVALLQDLAVMALLGVPHVERNGHHYFRGLSMWPDSWQKAATDAHPQVYGQPSGGWARLLVKEGALDLGSVNAAPFGLSPLLDPAQAGLERVFLGSGEGGE